MSVTIDREELIPSRTDVLSMARQADQYASANHTQWIGPEVINEDWVVARDERFAALVASRVAAHVHETEFKPDWNNYRQGFADGTAEEQENLYDLAKAADNGGQP